MTAWFILTGQIQR